MEPVSSPPQDSSEKKNPVPEQNPDPSSQQWVKGFKSSVMDRDLGECFMSKVNENASSVLELVSQWEEYEEEVKLVEVSLRKQILDLKEKEERLKVVEEREKRLIELKEKEKESDLKQNLELNVMMLFLENLITQLCAQEKVLNETIQEKLSELEKKEETFQLKQEAEAKEIEVKSEFLVLKEKKLEVKKNEISSLDETIKEKLSELEKKEENFQLKQEAEAKEIEEKSKFLVLKEKELEELKSKLEATKSEISLLDETIKAKSSELEKKQEAEAREIEEKSNILVLKEKELEEREKELVLKQRELEEESSTQAETRKRSRVECEPPLLAENTDSFIHSGKKHKRIRELYIETDSARVLHQKISSDPTSEHSSEVNEIDCTDLEPEPFNCPDPDFYKFNNTMSSFDVGQIWALYDPLDDMPRYYAQIKRIFKAQLSVRVRWLGTTETEKDIPIACGRFKYQNSETQSLLMFSHEMHHIKCGKHVIINPRKGETWALFRDWTKTWNSHKPSYRYDFVEVISEFDRDHGIGVAYLGRVEGFTSVYKAAEQHGLIKVMISTDEMLRFSHRVPSFKLTGDEKEEVPVDSFELDPAAIPRACLVAAKVKEETIEP